MGKTKRKYKPGEYRPMSPQVVDISGQVFGHWQVIEYNDHPKNTNGGSHWWCKCLYCGKIRSVWGHSLRAGLSDNCGCERNRKTGQRKFKDLTNQTFGRLTVISLDHMKKYDKGRSIAIWRCHCSCNGPNSDCLVSSSSLIRGDTRSCGCLMHEASIKNAESTATHKDSHTRLYHIWFNMISRCHVETCRGYPKYGAKGIYVCDEWRRQDLTGWEKRRAGNPGWLAFKEWAYRSKDEGGGGYYEQPVDTPRNDLLSIERKDFRGPYAPWNCEFIPMRQQATNRSNTQRFYDGETWGCFAEIERKYGVTQSGFMSQRLNDSAWSPDAVVHAMKHPDLKIHKTNYGYYDKDGFYVLIPKYGTVYEYNDMVEANG